MVDSSNLTMRNALLTENYAGSEGGGQGGGFIAGEGGNIIITGNVSLAAMNGGCRASESELQMSRPGVVL